MSQPVEVPEALRRTADAVLVFDDGGTLPVNTGMLKVHSTVLAEMLGSGDVNLKRNADGKIKIPVGKDDRVAWLDVLKVLYLQEKPLVLRRIVDVLDLMHKYDIKGLGPAVDAFIRGADLNPLANEGFPDVWRLTERAHRSGLARCVDKCCQHVVRQRLTVPDGVDLGGAAQALAVCACKALAAKGGGGGGGRGGKGGGQDYTSPTTGYGGYGGYGSLGAYL